MHIMKTETFRKLAEAIVCLRPDLLADEVTVDQVKIALGEIGDIWPASIFEEVAGDEPTQATLAKLRPQPMDVDEATAWAILSARYGDPEDDA